MKNIKYIIKRIIIGVGIALVLSFLRGSFLIGVSAKTIESYNWGYTVDSIAYNTTTYSKAVNPHPFIDYGTGYVYFTFDITGNTMQPALNVRSVLVSTAVNDYVCHVGTTTNTSGYQSGGTGTSSNQATIYSVYCPVNMDSTGIHWVHVNFNNLSNPSANFNIMFSSQVTFESSDDVTLNTTDTTNAINNQITNDNNNTQQQIQSQQVCQFIDRNSIVLNSTILNSSGQDVYSSNYSNYGVTDYISLSNSSQLSLLSNDLNDNPRICFYNVNKQFISCINSNSLPINSLITIPSSTAFFRSTIKISNNRPTYNLCKNGNQAIAEGQQDINNTLNDTTGVDDSEISNLFEDLDVSSDTPISDLITLPITLMQAFVSGFSSTCQSIHLGTLYGINLIFPCIDLEDYLGSSLWSIIDSLMSFFMIYNIVMLVVGAFDKVTSFNDEFGWIMYDKQFREGNVTH